MNEKYIQALIIGSLVGGAIILDDIINPQNNNDRDHLMIFKADDDNHQEIHNDKKFKTRIIKKINNEDELQDDVSSSQKEIVMIKIDSDSIKELRDEAFETVIDELEKAEIDTNTVIKKIKDAIGEDIEIEIDVKIEKESEN
jgi:hypothetical protein